MSSPLVSVIIPAFNVEKYIQATLDSILAQTWTNMEVIVTDDGSSDKTQSLINEYVERYPKIVQLIVQKNSGTSTARNNGINCSKGEIIAFMDADDIWLPNKLQRQVEIFNKFKDVSLVYTNAQCIDQFGNDYGHSYSSDEEINENPENIFSQLLLRNHIPLSSITVRKNIFEKTGLFNIKTRLAEDKEWLLKVAHKYQIYGIKDCLTQYRIHAMNKGKNNYREVIDILLDNSQKYSSEVKELGSKFSKVLSKKYYYYGYSLFEKGKLGEARKQFWASIVNDPFQRVQKYIYLILSFFPVSFLQHCRKLKRKILRLEEVKNA